MTPKCILWGVYDENTRSWRRLLAQPLTLPITVETSDIIDPAPPGGGLINVNRELGFDNAGRPVVSYHKYDAHGDLQVYAARRDTNRWNIVQVRDCKGYRWNFGGGGTIVVEVKVGAVRPLGGRRLALSHRYRRSTGVWVLDESTLRPIRGATVPAEEPLVPPVFAKVESTFPGFNYLDYQPLSTNYHLKRTAYWIGKWKADQ